MKKLKLVSLLLLITIVVLNICSISVFAGTADPILNPDFWQPTVSGDESLNEKVGVILGVIQVLGVVVSVVVLMVLGVKYMLGSAEEKAINKKAMIPYLVGAVMVFSVTTIPNVIFQISQDLFAKKNYAWINYDCKKNGHEYSFSGNTGKCDHYEKCRHICNHDEGAGWQDNQNGTCTCNTCGAVRSHAYNYKTPYKHACDCGYEEDHGYNYISGICYKCQAYCKHDWENGKCTKCETSCIHDFYGDESGQCTICDYKCPHEDIMNNLSNFCNRCGFTCRHLHNVKISETEHKCNECGYISEHTFDSGYGYCYGCSEYCEHNEYLYDNDEYRQCKVCKQKFYHEYPEWDGYGYEYGYGTAICRICGYECMHKNYVNEKCVVCGKSCEHIWADANGICAQCGYVCPCDGYFENYSCVTCRKNSRP